MSSNTEQSQYYIEKAILSTERYVGDQCVSMDISLIITEIHLFEDIRLPFVTGLIMISDTENVLNLMGFTGTEKLTLTVKSNVTLNGPSITKKFFIKNVVSQSDNNDMYIFNIVEESGFFWATTHIENGYEDKIENIIKTLLLEWSGKNSYDIFQESVQNEVTFMGHNKSLKEIIPQLTESICTDQGHPFFVFGTLFDSEIRIESYKEMIENESFNCQPFVYAPAYIQDMVENGDERGKYYNIISYNIEDDKSDYNLYQNGTILADMTSIDISTGQRIPIEFRPEEMSDVISNITGKNTGRQFVFNANDYSMNGLSVSETLKSKPTQVFTGQQYSDKLGFADRNTKQNNDPSIIKLAESSKRIREMLSKNMITVLVPGSVLFEEGATVGSQIDLLFTVQDENKQGEKGNPIDPKLSGKYVITNIKHMFLEDSHLSQLVITKLTAKEI